MIFYRTLLNSIHYFGCIRQKPTHYNFIHKLQLFSSKIKIGTSELFRFNGKFITHNFLYLLRLNNV